MDGFNGNQNLYPIAWIFSLSCAKMFLLNIQMKVEYRHIFLFRFIACRRDGRTMKFIFRKTYFEQSHNTARVEKESSILFSQSEYFTVRLICCWVRCDMVHNAGNVFWRVDDACHAM